VHRVFLAVAHVLDHLRIGEIQLQRKRPWLGGRLRIIDGDLNLQMTEIAPVEPFHVG
jgi:hypothetical protein